MRSGLLSSGAVAVLVTLGAASQNSGSLSGYINKNEPFRFIHNDVRAAVLKNKKAKSVHEWNTSGFTPSDIFQNVRALKSNSAWGTLCRSLGNLKDEDLALFEEEILKPSNSREVPCTAQLVARLDSYRSANSEELSKFQDSPGDKSPIAPVSLVFTGGPHFRHTPRILEILKEEGVKATFFEVGQKAREFPDLPKQAAQEGHVVASAPFSSTIPGGLSQLSLDLAEKEIKSGHEVVESTSGTPARLFRFPEGESSPHLETIAKSHGLIPAEDDSEISSPSWKIRNPSALLRNLIGEIEKEGGGTLQLRETDEQTVMMLPQLLKRLRTSGFTTVVFIPR